MTMGRRSCVFRFQAAAVVLGVLVFLTSVEHSAAAGACEDIFVARPASRGAKPTEAGRFLPLSVYDKGLTPNQAPVVQTKMTFFMDAPEHFRGEVENLVIRANRLFGQMNSPEITFWVTSQMVVGLNAYDILKNTAIINVKTSDGSLALEPAHLIHELFHSVFARNLKIHIGNEASSLYEVMVKAWTQFKQKELSLLNDPEYRALYLQIGESTQEATHIQNTQGIKAAKEKILAARKLQNDLLLRYHPDFLRSLQIRQFVGAYDELFADLSAALFHNDGKVIAESTRAFISPYEVNLHANSPRDFTQVVGFNHWQHEPTQNLYTMLDPSRGAIWALLYSKVNIETRPEDILRAFLLASEDHIKARLARGESVDHQKDPKTLNQEFFALFVSHGKKLGIWRK